MADITLSTFNTIALTGGEVSRLVARAAGRYNIHVMNLGPGTVWMRADAPPAIDDPQSLQLIASTADNNIVMDGVGGLGIVPNSDTTIVVRIA